MPRGEVIPIQNWRFKSSLLGEAPLPLPPFDPLINTKARSGAGGLEKLSLNSLRAPCTTVFLISTLCEPSCWHFAQRFYLACAKTLRLQSLLLSSSQSSHSNEYYTTTSNCLRYDYSSDRYLKVCLSPSVKACTIVLAQREVFFLCPSWGRRHYLFPPLTPFRMPAPLRLFEVRSDFILLVVFIGEFDFYQILPLSC